MGEKETMNINEVKQSADSVAVRPVPLFASSWVALFSFLRSNLQGEAGAVAPESADHEGDCSKR